MIDTQILPANSAGTDEPAVAGFASLELRPEIMRAIDDSGYTQPTPIQARAIPYVLARRDVIGIAQTGTGKTASFVLPMLHILAAGRARARMPRSLILSPTRELATQTARNFEIYGKHLQLTMALLIGGVGMGDQEKVLERGVDVLIATPGRLLDWFERGRVLLGGVEVLVIDEADRMFDMGFMPDVERIVSLLIGRKQTLLFSATMPPEVRRLADRFLNDPIEIKVSAPATTGENIEDAVIEVGADAKKRALVGLIKSREVPKAIIFCNRKRDIGGVMRHLQRAGLHARDLHGDLEQVHRQQTLDQFTRGEVDFLVATDVAARGLDISDMPVVVNFDVPFNPEDYVHRVGRTGRAGRKGRAFTLVTPEERKSLASIERLTRRPIPKIAVNGLSVPDDEELAAPRRVPARRRASPPAVVLPDEAVAPPPSDLPAPAMVEREVPMAPMRPSNGAERAVRGGRPSALERTPMPRERRPARERDEPVVGLGDHVPRFLLQPIPARLLKVRSGAEAE